MKLSYTVAEPPEIAPFPHGAIHSIVNAKTA